ncbi:MAG: sugar ABC transporter ATP-binding protein, partial [Candidatus Omnitrophica bacterium]|nr:sugar ABC transporter ATP-binding protein [Candidatus Omnitrophota bacterium]
MAAEPNLEVIEVRKTYPGTVALKGVSLSFAKGEVHALIGKNGAGKSTLVKIISGAVQPDSGSIQLRGSPIELKSPRDAGRNGIATVYQELSLIPDLSVAHNMLLADLPSRLRGFIIDWKCVYDRAAELLNSLDINLDVKQAVRKLGVASRQMVEIAKAMAASPSVLLLDEPT